MANAYLDRLRGQHDEIRARVEGLQTAAVAADRDLTEDELRSVTEDGAKATALAAQIESLHEQETRAAKVAALAPIAPPAAVETRGVVHTQDRDPGHYRTVKDGGTHSFFADMYKSDQNRDESARQRLTEHTRALSVGAGSGNTIAGGGIVPPRWMTDLFLPLSRQNRVLSAQVTALPLGDDPRAIVLPKQTAGTDAVVAAQVEGQAVSGADAYNTSTETLTPAAIAGKQTVSRQLVDSATPAVDQLIYTDLLSVYDAQIELLVANALVAAAGGATTTFATEAAFSANAAGTGSVAYNGVVDAETAVWAARFLAATLVGVSPKRWGAFRKLSGQDGRPLLSTGAGVPQNVVGTTEGATPNGYVGVIGSLPMFVTSSLAVTPGSAESHVIARASDAILAESDLLQFRFEEVAGPQDIVLGVWRYAGVLVRQSGNGVKRNVVTVAG